MGRGKDTGSWASEQARSPMHLELLRLRALRAYQAATKACEDAGVTNKHTITVLESGLVSTGTQSASDGPAKPLLVGSIPTLCSNICNKVKCPDCETCAVVEIETGVYHCMGCEAAFIMDEDTKAGETLCSHLVSPFNCAICYPRKLTTHICSLAPAQMQEGDDCLACKQKMGEARIKAIYT